MKKIRLIIVLALFGTKVHSQNVGIGTTPHASAQLDISAVNKGVLVPRVALTNVFLATPVSGPATGLLVWNTNEAVANGQGAGFYFWNGSRWQKLSSAAEGWSITGNNIIDTAINFIGTTSNTGLMFRVGNQKAGGIFPFGGNTFLGKGAGQFLKFNSGNFTGDENTFIGSEAGASDSTSVASTYIGSRAGINTKGSFGNTFVGASAGAGSTTGTHNTAIGLGAGNSSTGSRNVSMGAEAGAVGPGNENVMLGYNVASFVQGGNGNVWIGSNAGTGNFGLFPKAISDNNVFIGDSAAFQTNGAQANVFIGKRSGMSSTASRFNVFVGDSSGINNNSGNLNTFIGSKARGSIGSITNATAIGANAQAAGNNVVVLGSIAGINGATESVNVGIGNVNPNRRLYIQDGESSGVNSSGNSLLVLDKTGGPNYLSIINGNTFESGLVFGRAGSNQPPFDGGIFYNVSNTPGGMQFRNKGGLTRMVIHDDGNVSMGTSTNPARFFVALGTPSALTPFGNSTLVLDGGNSSQYMSMLSNGSDQGILFGTGTSNRDGGIFYLNAERSLTFRTGNNGNQLVINGNGRIGVGIDAPTARLFVRDGISTGVTASPQSSMVLERTGNPHYLSMLSNDFETGLLFGISGTPTATANGGILYNSPSNPQGMQFRTGGNSARMTIASDGKIGVGTTTPAYRLHVATADAQNFGFLEGILIENTATGLSGGGLSNTGEAAISFKNAGPDGTGSNQWMLGLNQNRNFTFGYGSEFNGASQRVVIDSTGNMGIGTATPAQKLHVIGNILASGTITPSDVRYKRNISAMATALPALMKVHPMYYQYNKEAFPEMGFTDERTLGVMAQELEALFPELVVTDSKGYKAVDYSRLSVVLLKALQEQQQSMLKQDADLERMKKNMHALEERLNKLENGTGKW